MNYIPLHLHTDIGSLMDGVATPEEYVARAKSLGMTALGITDHGSHAGHRRFWNACNEAGIKPILGVEAYITPDRFDKRDPKVREDALDSIYNHLIILAKNAEGLENLNKLNELAWTEGYYKKPRIDFKILDLYGDGLIVSTACAGGLINRAIEEDQYAVAKEHLAWFKNRFGDDFYVELMPHNKAGVNQILIDLAHAQGTKVVVTPDCHHCTPDQKVMQELMLILNTHPAKGKDVTYEQSARIEDPMRRLDYLYPDRKMTFAHFDIHMLSYEEMRAAMAKDGITLEEMFTSTLEIADKVEDYGIQNHLDLLPLKVKNPDKVLREKTMAGLKKRGVFDYPEYIERALDELGQIKDKGFAPYFLIEIGIIERGKAKDIFFGPGRGSAAGSLVAYANEITQVDPIRHNLLFSRFIDPTRNDFPDIDTDIQDNRREEVKQDLEAEYSNVANIATYVKFGGKDGPGKPGGKGLVKDVSRAFNVPLNDANKVCKSFEEWETFCSSPETLWFRNKYPFVEHYGEQLLGRVRSTGIHAAGVVTASEPIFKHANLETRTNPKNPDERVAVIGVDMETAEEIGLIKFDLLGLKTLTVIDDCVKMIKERHKIDINVLDLDLADKNVFHSLATGATKGVFQCEQAPSTNLIVAMGVSNFDELVASNALVRPGAKQTVGKEYLARKQGKKAVTYVHPDMEPFLLDTYGVIIYQEQVMQACMTLGGMSGGEANKVRRIIGKKKNASELDPYKAKFLENAAGKVGMETAEHLWHDFEAHAGYSFNKSHAVAYSMISYWTAWLKFYYPLEFMYAILKWEGDNDDRTIYLIETKRLGIPIKLPHVNESQGEFSIEGKGIRFGFSAVKYLTAKGAEPIIAARPFKSYSHFMDIARKPKSGFNSRAVSALDAIGAIAFEDHPRDPQKVKENLYEFLNLPEFNIAIPAHMEARIGTVEDFEPDQACTIMGMVKKIKRGKGWSLVEVLDRTGSVGVFDVQDTHLETGKTYLFLVGNNSILEYVPADNLKAHKDLPLLKYLDFKQLPLAEDESYVLAFKPRVTKAGKRMATMCVADWNRTLSSILVFPQQFATGLMKCEPGTARKLILSETSDGTQFLNGVK